MKKKNALSFYDVRLLWETPTFAFLIAVFLCGVIAGSFTGMQISHSNGTYIVKLSDYFVSQMSDGQTPLYYQMLIRLAEAFSYPILLMLCGMLAASQFWVSALIAARGFLLSFSVAAIISQLGMRGFYLSLASMGLSAVISVPCLLLIGVAVLIAAGGQQGGYSGMRQYLHNMARYRRALLLCGLLLIASAVCRVALVSLALIII